MKKTIRNTQIICFLLIITLLFLTSCGAKEYTDKDNYDLIFHSVVSSVGKIFELPKPVSLLSFSEYAYCSYLALFPRTQPKEIADFYYLDGHGDGINFDPYIVYLVYHLNNTDFNNFENKLSNFKIEYDGQINTPIYDTEHFKYPTYILTWMNAGNPMETYGIAEYVMLDKENGNVINVFKMCESFQDVQNISAYDIMPSAFEVADIIPEEKQNYNDFHHGFSIYSFKDADGNQYIPDYDDLESQFLK